MRFSDDIWAYQLGKRTLEVFKRRTVVGLSCLVAHGSEGSFRCSNCLVRVEML